MGNREWILRYKRHICWVPGFQHRLRWKQSAFELEFGGFMIRNTLSSKTSTEPGEFPESHSGTKAWADRGGGDRTGDRREDWWRLTHLAGGGKQWAGPAVVGAKGPWHEHALCHLKLTAVLSCDPKAFSSSIRKTLSALSPWLPCVGGEGADRVWERLEKELCPKPEFVPDRDESTATWWRVQQKAGNQS